MNFSAAVLAGGRSSRMGRDKAALPYFGGTLLQHQAATLESLGIDDIMISGGDVKDIYPGLGPVSGIHACLMAAKHDAVLFLSVDMPLVPAEELIKLLRAHSGGATVFSQSGKTEPLPGVYDKALASKCEELLKSGSAPLRRLLDATHVARVPFSADERLLINCNTPGDWEKVIGK